MLNHDDAAIFSRSRGEGLTPPIICPSSVISNSSQFVDVCNLSSPFMIFFYTITSELFLTLQEQNLLSSTSSSTYNGILLVNCFTTKWLAMQMDPALGWITAIHRFAVHIAYQTSTWADWHWQGGAMPWPTKFYHFDQWSDRKTSLSPVGFCIMIMDTMAVSEM